MVMIEKNRKYPVYKPSGVEWIGEIPQGWVVRKVKIACSFQYGEHLAENHRLEGEFPVFGSNGIVGYHNVPIASEPCIIIGRKGSYGKLNYSSVKCFPIDTTFYIDKHNTNNNIKWLYYSLNVLKLDEDNQDSAVPGLNREEAYSKLIPIPPLPEQQVIANFLDRETLRINTIIEKQTRLIELLREKRSALITHAVTKGLDQNARMKPSGVEWIGEIPEGWEVIKLKFVSKKIKTGSTPKSDVEEYYNGNIPWFTPESFDDRCSYLKNPIKYISSYAITKSEAKLFFPYSIFLVGIGATIGKVAIVKFPSSCNQQINVINISNGSARFFYYYLKIYEHEIIFFASFTTLPILNQNKTGQLLVCVPPVNEQEDIVQFLDYETNKIDTIIGKIEKQIELLNEYKQSLITAAVTGKIDVREVAHAENY